MKLLCSRCKHYRTIVYADGSCAMGCLKASENDYPIDIRHLDDCPRKKKTKRKAEVQPAELLRVLGKLYAECSPHPVHLSLYQYLSEAGETVRKYKSSIGHVIITLGILKIVSRGVEGKRGNTCVYKWNIKDFGAPSYDLVDKIIQKMSEAIEDDKLERLAKSMSSVTPQSRTLQIDEGVTSCEVCWLKNVPDCHAKLLAMGLDCKKMNINTIRYGESSVG